jgi:hypothetical protein
MKKLSLRPYHGTILLCSSRKELKDTYEKLTKCESTHNLGREGGICIRLERDTIGERKYLIWASNTAHLAHELCHALLQTFEVIGHNPTQGDGEPFCYMLTQLMLEAQK